MEKKAFKQHTISRSTVPQQDDYKKYKVFLQKDFNGRCGYCDMPQELITASFHIDHFIPQKIFKGKKDYLKTDYNNLIYACPKCNLSKSGAYEGKIENETGIVNELFYNPVDTDYNTIFYRDKLGGIHSDDKKGQNMIEILRLYRPVHQKAWLLENLERISHDVYQNLNLEDNSCKKAMLQQVYNLISYECIKLEKNFRCIYRDDKFQEK